MKNLKTISSATILFVIVCSIFFACKKTDDEEPGGGGGDPTSTVKIMTNSSDPLLLSNVVATGETVEYFGTRDQAGNPLALTHIYITKPDGNMMQYFFDESHHVTKMIADNGCQVLLEWLSNTSAAVTVVSADGLSQVNTVFDTQQKLRRNNNTPSQPRTAATRMLVQDHQAGASANKTSVAGNVKIHLSRCGKPALGTVWLNVKSEGGTLLANLPAQYTGTEGEYVASIPSGTASTIDPTKLCENMIDVLGYACDYTTVAARDAMCVMVGAAIVAAGNAFTAPIAAELTAACTAFSHGIEIYCGTLGSSPTAGAPSLAEQLKLCKVAFQNRKFTEDLVLIAGTPGLPYSIYSYPVKAPGNGPYPDVQLSMGNNPTINSISLSPANPAADQDYTAKAYLYCLPNGSTITMSVKGSDGYTKTNTETVTGTQVDKDVYLTVPGAESGVEDVITLTVDIPGGNSITRTASLVFN
jgi:hypothetical protein